MSVRPVPVSGLPRQLGAWRDGDGPLAEQLARAVEQAILDGRLPLGGRLPAERVLARDLGLARGTVATCYQLLRTRQLITTRTGSGSITALPPGLRSCLAPWTTHRGRSGERGAPLDLTLAEPAAPFDELLQAIRTAADHLPSVLLHEAPAGSGSPSALTTVIADAYTAQGLPTHSGNLLLTSGADAALNLIAAAFLRHRDPVVVDSPTYPGALSIFRAAGARLLAHPVNHSGWDIAAFDHLLGTARPSLAYLCPDFHNPTGLLMNEGQRADLRRRLRRHDTLVVIDETMRDLDLQAPGPHGPVPPPSRIATSANDRRVLLVGSLSKTLWPGLRTGWIRANPGVIRHLSAFPLAAPLAPTPLDQLVAVQLLKHHEQILAKRRAQLRRQRDHLSSRMAALPWCRFHIPQGGLSLWLELLDTSSSQLAALAANHDLLLTPGHHFSPDGTLDRYLRFPFTLDTELLDTAVDRLAVSRVK